MTGGNIDSPLSDLLPDPIILDILTRIPTKTLFRFKSVSKAWLSYISHPFFISTFLSLNPSSWAILDRVIKTPTAPAPDPDLLLSLSSPPEISHLSVGPNLLSSADRPDNTSAAPARAPLIITSSKHGLILFSINIKRDPQAEHKKDRNHFSHRYDEPSLYICNPVTRQWVGLGKPKQPINSITCVGFITKVDRSTDQTRFVVIEYQPLCGSDFASLLTYDSDTCEWITREGNFPVQMPWVHMWRQDGAFEFDDKLFWIDLSIGLIVLDDPFSTGAQKCRFIPLPEGHQIPYNQYGLEKIRSIDSTGGCIQYTELNHNGNDAQLMMWRLGRGYKGWSFVCKVGVIDIWSDQIYLPAGGSLDKLVSLCLINPHDGDVVVFKVGKKLVSVNVKDKKVVGILNNFLYKGATNTDEGPYLFPVVVPTWPAAPLPRRLVALLTKNRGNEYFKKGKFHEAVTCYSESIINLPTAASYANRAAAYLKMKKYFDAETDCTEALKLDEQYAKVYVRRAMARKELGKLALSKEDAEDALQLGAERQEVTELLAEVNSLFEQVKVVDA